MAVETTTTEYPKRDTLSTTTQRRVLLVISGFVEVQIKQSNDNYKTISTTSESLELTNADRVTYRIVPAVGASYEVL